MFVNHSAVGVAICTYVCSLGEKGCCFWFCCWVYLGTAWDSPVRSTTTWCCLILFFLVLFYLVNWPYVHEVAGNHHWSASTEYGSRVLIFHTDVKRWSFLSSKERMILVWMKCETCKYLGSESWRNCRNYGTRFTSVYDSRDLHYEFLLLFLVH